MSLAEDALSDEPALAAVAVDLDVVELEPLDLGPPRERVGDTRRWGPSYVGPKVLILTVAFVAAVVFVCRLLGPAHGPVSGWQEVLRWSSIAWCFPLFSGLFGIAGAVTYRSGRRHGRHVGPAGPVPTVYFRIVTRGENVEAVVKTVRAAHEAMRAHPVFPYQIEVVTDRPVLELDPEAATQFVVPDDYETANGARFKARALHYALEVSPAPDRAWLFHLDEETHVTPGAVEGIRRAVLEEEATGRLRAGQGAILYHRDLRSHPLLTLADSIRTGDDVGRFNLQYRAFNRPLFGMHGSFILVRNDVEKSIGFDFGPAGSITEDAWWALTLADKGGRVRWVDGFCVEQSTRSVKDFLKQRRRWLIGLALVAIKAPVRLRTRSVLGFGTVMWGVGCIGLPLNLLALSVGVRQPGPLFYVSTLTMGLYLAFYWIGAELALSYAGMRLARRVLIEAAALCLMPVWASLESLSVFYAVIKPERGFHVVKK